MSNNTNTERENSMTTVEIDGHRYYDHSYVNSIACRPGHRGRGDIFAAVRSGRIPAPHGDGNTHLWNADVVDAAEALYEFGPGGVNGFGFDRDGYGPDGRHGVTGYTREGRKQAQAETSRIYDALAAQRVTEQRRAEAAILKRVDEALSRDGKHLSNGGWGWMAQWLGGDDVVIANVPRGGNCRRCDAIGTQQGMPNLVRHQGGWQDFDQCGSCGSIGGVNAPYRVVEDVTVEKLVTAVRELAGRSA